MKRRWRRSKKQKTCYRKGRKKDRIRSNRVFIKKVGDEDEPWQDEHLYRHH